MQLGRRTAIVALIAAAFVSRTAHATDWPTKQVTIYVTTAAGGNTDLMARMAAEYLTTKFGKPFVVENRPSAGGAQASGAVVNAAPDGYSLLFTPSSAIGMASPGKRRVSSTCARSQSRGSSSTTSTISSRHG